MTRLPTNPVCESTVSAMTTISFTPSFSRKRCGSGMQAGRFRGPIMRAHEYNSHMAAIASRAAATSRVIRPGDALPEARDGYTTPEQRIEAVWELTLQCLAFQGIWGHEPRLQRSIVRVQRAPR